ncbi:MAG: trimethylamine methyltransferase family protein [Acidimicrobiia bacterium]|nr:trimethylamine methyltransferase family protein [Acidimicrobiia bacterium]MDH4308437.1 trimethylamine methyltransferase family protein [Acidimicrobiia bacterium]
MTRRRTRVRPGRDWTNVRNRVGTLSAVGDDELQTIHDASLRLLSETGMQVLDPAARRLLASAGCQVTDERVHFDPELVMDAVAAAPDRFELRARNPAKNLRFGGDVVVFAAVGGPAFVHDLDRGRRQGTYADQCDYLRLIGSLDIIHQEGGGPFEALDLPAATRHLDLFLAASRLLDKNWQGVALGRERAADSIDMMAIALGTDREGLATAPGVLAIVNTNSPLTLDAPMAEGLMTLAEAGQVVCATPFTLAGAMAPSSLAGAIVLQNAEVLACVTLTQLVRRGVPVMYGSFTSNVDMRSGSPAFGTPEYTKAAQIGGQLARRYGLPYRSSNTTSSNSVDAQAAYESQMSLWGAVLGGAHLVNHAAGWLEGGLTASFEKLVVDAEMCQMMAAYLEPIPVDAEEIGLDAIADVGPGGHFFASPHTLARYETAFYAPLVSDRRNYESWLEAGSEDTAVRANRIWKELVGAYEPQPLPPGVLEELAEFVERRKRELTG